MTDNELRDLRLRKQLPAKEIVEVVRTIYPKFDKPLLSKCENGGVYGVQLRADAMKALRVAYCPESPNGNKVSRHGKHRLSCCVSARLESGVHTSLEAAVRRNVMGGLGLMQEQISKRTHDEMEADGEGI